MRFLVATDGSGVSDTAVEYAAKEANAWNASLEIVHVLTPETELVDGTLVLPGEDEAVKYGEQTLEQAKHHATEIVAASNTGTDTDTDSGAGADVDADSDTDADAEIEIATELLAGRPAEAIVDHADESGVTGIYVGHRGLSDERERVVGSVAKTVVDKATVPVTIIK
ncbi:universal stress protein [Natronorubrum sp. JWXQ-INN-674]|uniref:Universal stress protein n=1 Tax=Natronorubrum halalkaliphilum TaxID=2691917 RepID=A0A6B0VNH0_9EURY|nr:universal stress protein [Natronorubrum halalkaliphilum]MXV63331.1 universal stress protein [Natronorubrum halalkaliphilum]